jgi:surface polysaccharide O-acyltransferase-like enzyme
MNIPRFVASLIVIVLGALMIADSALVMAGQSQIFFEGVSYKFEFVVGFVVIVLAASIMDLSKKEPKMK